MLRSSAGIAIAMAVMNVGTYAFQMVAARLLGPSQYGAVAGMMALLMVLSVVQLGLQATAARRIAAAPEDVAAIEQTVLTTTWRAAFLLGALAARRLTGGLVAAPPRRPAARGAARALRRAGHGHGWPGRRAPGRAPLAAAEPVYLSVGVPRVLLGGAALAISATETSAMVGVLAASWLPVLIGSWALRNRSHDAIVTEHDREVRRDVRRETYASSVALLAFVALSNLDIVVARNVLDDHQAGLYAGGLIVTKAVLFLPQFAVVILFPSMSTAGESRAAAHARPGVPDRPRRGLRRRCLPAQRPRAGLHRRRRLRRRAGPALALRRPRRPAVGAAAARLRRPRQARPLDEVPRLGSG